MTASWNEGVRGEQALPIINEDSPAIRVEAGPGTGKTFSLVRRVERILHPDGLGVRGKEVLIVAFNRAIAKQLREDISSRLTTTPHDGEPRVQTVHALCLKVVGEDLRLLLPHEREAMVYDILHEFPDLKNEYETHKVAEQALRDHEAKHEEHIQLWQAARRWLARHRAQLLSDLPGLLLNSLEGGDYGDQRFKHVIVDEFQDLTPGEQELFLKLRTDDGNFVALGDSRQSIYAFRGNDRKGLSKLATLLAPEDIEIRDLTMSECQRCPPAIVHAANTLMNLYESKSMTSGSDKAAAIHIVRWETPRDEAVGMARAIVENIQRYPSENHLVMVTRRQFGYWLRDEISKIDPSLKVDLSFSEGLLETWPVREAFLFFCLIFDPEPPTWRAWLGYQTPTKKAPYKAPSRNAGAYLEFLTRCSDAIAEHLVAELASEPRSKRRGQGGVHLRDRATRFVELREQFDVSADDPRAILEEIFDGANWDISDPLETAGLDMRLLLDKAFSMLEEFSGRPANEQLSKVARGLRHQIATREPFVEDETADLDVTTLWGAKGVTADHVYVLGLCEEAMPGEKRDEYPGTDVEYLEEQRRLFYVSITRSRRTLVLSRAIRIPWVTAQRLGLKVSSGSESPLHVCPFMRDLRSVLPPSRDGRSWQGCE